MERLFETHQIRKCQSLEGLWDFYPADNPGDRRRVWVPCCVETCPGYENYRGVSVFEREIDLEGNVRLCFKGVSHTAEVFLDGKKIGAHYNAYTPFEILLNGIESGRHLLKVTADNSCHPGSALHVINDYYNYGGISRPATAESLGEAYVKRIHVKPFRRDGIWRARIQVWLVNLTDQEMEATLRLRLQGGGRPAEETKQPETAIQPEGPLQPEAAIRPEDSPQPEAVAQPESSLRPEAAARPKELIQPEPLVLPAGETAWEREFTFPDVRPYEPDAPALYTIQALLEQDGKAQDDLIERFGFREISIRGNRIYFNDRPLSIRGFNRHEDHGAFGCAIPVEAMDQDLRLMEELGANAVRTCHYPNDERFLDLCDEKGILVWEEGHARGLSEEQMRHPAFRSQSLACLDEMVQNHYNHPSIFTWGILNECASDTEYGREIYAEQYGRLRSLDDSRPLTSATCKHFTDICLDLPDIVSVNIYPGWYVDEKTAEYLEKEYAWVQSTAGADKPFLVSEIGAGGISGYHASHRPKWSEERQGDILREQLEGVLGFAPASGVFVWQFADGRVPDEWFNFRPGCKNNKGVVDGYRRKKLAFDVVKQCFHRR